MIVFIYMNKSSRYRLYIGLLILFLSVAGFASADVNINVGEVQLSVAGILLDVEGSTGVFDQIAFNGSSFDVTINNNQSFIFSSADRRQFSFSPASASSYVSRSCSSSKSTLTINGSGLSGPLTITITPETSLCSSASDGGGGIVTGNIIGYNFGPTPELTPLPAPIFVPAPEIGIIAPELTPDELQPYPKIIPTAQFEPTAPIYIPPQPESPAPESPIITALETTLSATENFLLLYWPWIIAILAAATLVGILLFIALRE